VPVAGTKREIFSLLCSKNGYTQCCWKTNLPWGISGLWEQMNFGDIKECTSGNK